MIVRTPVAGDVDLLADREAEALPRLAVREQDAGEGARDARTVLPVESVNVLVTER